MDLYIEYMYYFYTIYHVLYLLLSNIYTRPRGENRSLLGVS
jgi:hypothetical protein